MKIYFGCTTSQFDKYQKYYFAIRDLIVDEGHVLTRDWLQIYKHELLYEPDKLHANKEKQDAVYKKTMKAFYDADILIAENTVPSFSNGHLMTLALQRKIPVLVLQLQDRPKRYLKRSFIQGISSEYLEIKDYNFETYKDVIKSFLKKYEESFKKHRFHLVIDEVERRYLEWAKYNKKSSKTKLIRKALRKIIDEDDQYRKFLEN